MVAAAHPAMHCQHVPVQGAPLGRNDRVRSLGHDLAGAHPHGCPHLGYLVVVADAERGAGVILQIGQVASAHCEPVGNH